MTKFLSFQRLTIAVFVLLTILSACKRDDDGGSVNPGGDEEPVPNDLGINYYVSNAGNDSNDGLTPKTAWKTSARVQQHSNFEPGDMVLFRRGDTFDKLTLDKAGNGTVDEPIIFGAYGNEDLDRPIINGDRTPFSFAINLRNMGGWIIQDLKVQGANGDQIHIQPIEANCDNIKILNCHIDGVNGRHCIRFDTDIRSGNFFGCSNVEVAYNLIENAGQNFDNTSDGVNGPNIQKNGYIHHNEFFNNKSEAVDLGAGKGHIVEYNLMDGNNDRDSGGIKTHVQSGNQINDTENIDLRYNVIKNCIQHAIQIQDGRSIRVFNNTIYHNQQNGKNALLIGTANDNQYDDNSWIGSNEIKNNIFHGVTHTISITVLRWAGGRAGTPAVFWDDPNRYDIKNNIFYAGDEGNAIVIRIQTGQFMSDNQFTEYSNIATTNNLPFSDFTAIHTNNFNVNPDFNDPDNGDFTLKPDSPAIGAGIDVGLAKDFNDKDVSNSPNIGAFEN
ncbi:right-handed parallel beta-helix repeat-containing protein [Fulvivirgaceae bacterium BMA10]|uniref:Right-handed parallel beta-helix repeat-containing protein n=1 Tax=Splendidivirga corallicola TaxID=3051826 RepID=A0ABT8KYI1_9BACT|nr:right-handed parallel beta-helix repeat-containing protein [Fulvivirgaceae bacterium BMA10]